MLMRGKLSARVLAFAVASGALLAVVLIMGAAANASGSATPG